jgi:XTP/dITP diphosphohydrolase
MKIYLASGNAHKVKEMNALAAASGLDIEIISAKAVGGMPPVVEDTGTFIGNARKKAAALKSILPPETWVLADDSGLCVNALGGLPGVESAYYAGPEGNSAANLEKLVTVMKEVPENKRGAHFICILFLLGPKNTEYVFEGRCEGTLLRVPQGGAGFGYDPLFKPEGYEQSFAAMSCELKMEFSHRGRAWRAFAMFCSGSLLMA